MRRCCIRPARSARRSTSWRSRRSRRIPDKFCILGHFDLQAPNREEIVRNWRQRPGMLGFRFTFNQPQQKSVVDRRQSRLVLGRLRARETAGRAARRRQHGGVRARSPSAIPASSCISTITAGPAAAAAPRTTRRSPICPTCWRWPNCRMSRSRFPARPSYSSRALPVPQRAGIHRADHRRVRAAALLLGHRRHPHAVQLPAMRDDVHRGIAVAAGKRS